jgi:hypothetical protein
MSTLQATNLKNPSSASNNIVLDSSGRVGVGTASPSSALHVVGNQFLTAGNYFTDTTSGYFFNGAGGFAGGVYGSNSGTVANIVSPQTIAFGTASSERGRFDSLGRLLIGTTSATTNGGVLQVSNGITFPATQSPCSDPNTLDDYEEGTWTPSLNGNESYTTREARYTKIGRLVHVSFYIVISSLGTGNTSTIYGLPFQPLADTGGSALSYWTNTVSSICSLAGYIYGTQPWIYLYSNTAASTGLVSNSIMKNGTAVQGHLSYFAA